MNAFLKAVEARIERDREVLRAELDALGPPTPVLKTSKAQRARVHAHYVKAKAERDARRAEVGKRTETGKLVVRGVGPAFKAACKRGDAAGVAIALEMASRRYAYELRCWAQGQGYAKLLPPDRRVGADK